MNAGSSLCVSEGDSGQRLGGESLIASPIWCLMGVDEVLQRGESGPGTGGNSRLINCESLKLKGS